MSLRKFSDVSVGDLLPEKTVTLTRGNLVNYTGVSGDPNPIHFSDEVARLAGLPDVVAQGMLSMGMGAGYVTEWLGDPGAVTEYNVRFTSPVIVAADTAAEIEFTAKVKSIDEDSKTAVLAIVAKSEGRKIFGRATATVRLA
ncbi:(3R)-hydroxyacyl-ACP dehydratase subunit HadB [Rhodococcus sp. NPDC056743]|jgi:acyl dehydratase|uniref:(3R)-hydroxyacyl-ACP dehydratase subunit HadB n=1 Tax=unclassified Rhodococcus (in: high G+C Gram-positive bacteria) TaxID=192944 RepID=UPI00110DF0E4|nr:(3R)-hydroxyacyl-ACP dehydratase subunit HadB [Rhodococcus sp. KBS0724]TSD48520.1 (3R)-hydroxyacyl-ACP dehydratase subunit HadB [Rhodococcus sp. KBS0724]